MASNQPLRRAGRPSLRSLPHPPLNGQGVRGATINVTGDCRLCGKSAELQLSHILPAFVYRWLRATSGNGHIRASNEPNRRAQDGPKRHWLCASCEELFGRSETAFSRQLFHPYLKAPAGAYRYSSWLLHFCASVAWRVLRFHRDEGHLGSWDAEALRRVDRAEVVWREFLLGNRIHPDSHQLHLLPLERLATPADGLSPAINRYLMRVVALDVCRRSDTILTFAKLGRFIVLGFVHEPNPNHWKGSKVHVAEGSIEPRKYVAPQPFGEYLTRKASEMQVAQSRLSDRQQARVEKAFRGES